MRRDKLEAIQWAQRVLSAGTALILDTETTGLDGRAEIVQIGICDLQGQTVLDTLVKPTQPIPAAAKAVHGISDAQVMEAPTFDALVPELRRLIAGRSIVIYNADYDTRLLRQSGRRYGIELGDPVLGARAIVCAMHPYSTFVGDWSEYHGNYRWQRLPAGDHSALGDCRATLTVLQQMAAAAPQEA